MGAEEHLSEEVELAKSILSEIQPLSIKQNREYCGLIGFDRRGWLVATEPVRGEEGFCDPLNNRRMALVVASYHTHGAFSRDYFNEVPSVMDVYADHDEGIDGYVSTPGGRLWYIDGEDMVISMICDLGCLPSDPDFIANDMGPIEPSYTLEELERLLAQ